MDILLYYGGMENINIGDKVFYDQKERKVLCLDFIENLVGIEPITEPEEIVWVRFENISLVRVS